MRRDQWVHLARREAGRAVENLMDCAQWADRLADARSVVERARVAADTARDLERELARMLDPTP